MFESVKLSTSWRAVFSHISHSWLFKSGLNFSKPIDVTVKDLDAFLDRPAEQLKNLSKRKLSHLKSCGIDIHIGPKTVLSRIVRLPLSAIKYSEKALRLDLQKNIPIPLNQLTWKNRQTSRSKSGVEFEQLVVKNDKLALLEAACKSLGVPLRSIKMGSQVFFEQTSVQSRMDRGWMGLACFFFLAVLGFKFFQSSSELTSTIELHQKLLAENQELKSQAVAQRDYETNAQKSADAQNAVIEMVANDRGHAAILWAITQELPDQVWVSEWDRRNTTLKISGFSKIDIPEVIQILNELDVVKKVIQKSASKKDRKSNSQRFQLELQLETQSK